jgi:hypothetical protein
MIFRQKIIETLNYLISKLQLNPQLDNRNRNIKITRRTQNLAEKLNILSFSNLYLYET